MATRIAPAPAGPDPSHCSVRRRPRWRRYLRVLLPQWHRVLLYGLGYLYFLRFSLALWLFAPFLCCLNYKDQSLTSGILVSEFLPQYLCIGFCLVTAGLASLVMMRIVLINGNERWGQKTPQLLRAFFANDCGRFENLAVLFSQLPNLIVGWYLLALGIREGVAPATIWGGLLVGAAMALGAWWLANSWYYLHFRVPDAFSTLPNYILGKNAARTVLLPRWCFHLNRAGATFPGRPSIEQAVTVEDLEWAKKRNRYLGIERLNNFLVNRPGYGSRQTRGAVLYEAHHFAIIAMTLLLYVYLLVWPLTAPVPRPGAAKGALFAFALFGAYPMFVMFATAKPSGANTRAGRLLAVKIGVGVALTAIFVAIWLMYDRTSVERFPIFATVLIMATTMVWFLAGLAFFFDRYRIPVLAVFVIALAGPRLMHWDRALWSPLRAGQEEHYISVTPARNAGPVPTPSEILANRIGTDDRPLIIVTATGGGLHASAWTAAVLTHLERQFGPDFHKHLLLMSTVSGGSTGLLTYLRELHEGKLDTDPELAFDRMQSASQCSSLEGVGWGLIYYDLPKAVVPLIPYFVSPSPGDQDLDTSPGHHNPFWKDRTWTLRKSFDRNLHNKYCAQVWASDQGGATVRWDPAEDAKAAPPEGLTLRDFLDTSAYPAITMNTTVVESGERFLLANYRIPEVNLDQGPNYRARSFLETFKTESINGQTSTTDLPLATAAQLSATFPLVSSSARVPLSLDGAVNSVHFADGGYYDNDGTASALEFLRYALSAPSHPTSSSVTPAPAENAQQAAAPAPPVAHPVRILLIEIRNSGDINGSGPESVPDHNGGTTPWNLFSQATAPLLGFWQAGHESITPRDQSALELLEHAYDTKLEVEAIVFADLWSQEDVGTDPLNWSLTPRQRKEVVCSANRGQMRSLYKAARDWFYATEIAWKATITPPAATAPGQLPDPPMAGCQSQ